MTYRRVLDSVPLAATRFWCGHNGRVTACDKCSCCTVPWLRVPENRYARRTVTAVRVVQAAWKCQTRLRTPSHECWKDCASDPPPLPSHAEPNSGDLGSLGVILEHAQPFRHSLRTLACGVK
ncbi:hypothetical protein IG631_16402 [Alternaria alternata]|nr:hypothetical protein IG631_16402 [Alternaria alternata]